MVASSRQCELVSVLDSQNGLLQREGLLGLIETSRLIASSSPPTVTENSILMHLGPIIKKYIEGQTIELGQSQPEVVSIELGEEGYELGVGELVIGATLERVTIPPDHFGMVDPLDNSRIINHLNDSHIDPGFRGTITLELANVSNEPYQLLPDDPIGQFYLTELESGVGHPYRGKYYEQEGPTPYLL